MVSGKLNFNQLSTKLDAQTSFLQVTVKYSTKLRSLISN